MAYEESHETPENRENSSEQGSSSTDDSATSRRHFLKSTAAGLLGALAGSGYVRPGCATEIRSAASFQSRWPADVERYWIGPAYWANPLSEWRLAGGRLECIGSGDMDHTVQHLTRQIGAQEGTLDLRVRVGFAEDGPRQAGFEVGVQGPLKNYRNSAVKGQGLQAGLTADGELFIGDVTGQFARSAGEDGIMLHLTAAPEEGAYTLALSALDAASGAELGRVRRTGVPADRLVGNLALFTDTDEDADARWGEPCVWFRDWTGGGTKLVAHDEHAFGPILFNHYTLSRGVMKMTAQLPPVGAEDDQAVRLQVEQDGDWQTIADAPIHELARTATFCVEDWDDRRDVPYRLAYHHRTADGLQPHHYEGVVRRDPVEKESIIVGGLSCALDTAFPNTEVVEGLRYHDPDLLAFTGDQYYEGTGGYVRRAHDNVPLATLDVLHRWYMHGWTYAELTRDRPAVCLLDDHDVFHANIWGEGGKDIDRFGQMADGGFFMPVAWINAVQHMQTAHMPDPYDPTPIRNGITVYYTDMLYGRVSFALLEDRKWKSGPRRFVKTGPDTPPDWIVDPGFDPAEADAPEARLLGDRQLAFLENWAADWRGADMKTVVSQTSFAQLPTHHGPRFRRLTADLDSNGWPQTPRDEALRRFRKGFAFHIGGDQHLPMMLRYGIDDWNDAPYNFCVPGVAVGWTRAFWPEHSGNNHEAGTPYYTGEYLDGFNNKMTVYAVANPEHDFRRRPPLAVLADKSSGYGIIRFHKPTREITMECWPILSDPRQDDEQYAGWPKTVAMEDNYARAAAAYLPTLSVSGTADPMVQVVDEERNEVVYALRIQGTEFRPKVFREGSYTVRVGDDTDWRETITGVCPAEDDTRDVLEVTL